MERSLEAVALLDVVVVSKLSQYHGVGGSEVDLDLRGPLGREVAENDSVASSSEPNVALRY